MLTEANILSIFETHGLPSRGIHIDFLPSDNLIRQLTSRFGVEFAVMFTILKNGYGLFVGTNNSASIPIGDDQILLKHSHPRGTPHPSKADHIWLKTAQQLGSPQIQSIILPIGKNRVTFNINTPYIS
jgi:hypothetical protein